MTTTPRMIILKIFFRHLRTTKKEFCCGYYSVNKALKWQTSQTSSIYSCPVKVFKLWLWNHITVVFPFVSLPVSFYSLFLVFYHFDWLTPLYVIYSSLSFSSSSSFSAFHFLISLCCHSCSLHPLSTRLSLRPTPKIDSLKSIQLIRRQK